MAEYPSGVYSPRTKQNKTGVVYDAAKTKIGYAEDITKLDDEVVAIETELGIEPKGIFADVKTRLEALIPYTGADQNVDLGTKEVLTTGKATIGNNADVVQLTAKANAAQTADIVQILDKLGNPIFSVDNDGIGIGIVATAWNLLRMDKIFTPGNASTNALYSTTVINATVNNSKANVGLRFTHGVGGSVDYTRSSGGGGLIGASFSIGMKTSGDIAKASMFSGGGTVDSGCQVYTYIGMTLNRPTITDGAIATAIGLNIPTFVGAGITTARGITIADDSGIGTTTPRCKLDVGGAIASASLAFSTEGPTDDLDVSGINTLFINAGANAVTIGGLVGGVDGQVLNIVIIDPANNATLEHAEGGGNQDILLHAGADETIDGHYGGWTLVCHAGVDWHDASHAKHV